MPARIDFATLDLMSALDLAVLIEVEAHERYKLFADRIGYRFAGDAASLFVSMAENEAKHARELLERRRSRFGDAPVRVSRDDLFDVEAPDQGAAPVSTSPRQALEIALASEEKAHAFYADALEHVSDPEIRALFLELRDEETEHIRMVREAMAQLPPGSDAPLDQDEDELPAL